MDSLDGSGKFVVRPADFTEDFFSRGLIVNRDGHASLRGQTDAINDNSVFDTLRRMSQWVRIIQRSQFVGMSYDGVNTYLWFLPTRALGGRSVDLFSGIRDAIVHEPTAPGWTNEWVAGVDLKAYDPSPSSVYKPDAFADIFPSFLRGLFYSPEVANDPSLLWHFGYGQAVPGTFGGIMVPEAYDALTYARLTRTWLGRTRVNTIVTGGDWTEETRRNFYKSCQIYQPPMVIEQALTIAKDGVEYVRLTLRGRLQSTVGEPGGAEPTFSDDRGTWTRSVIEAEPYRTLENGLRLYLIHVDTGFNPTWVVGDRSANSDPSALPDWGSIYPSFFFTKLVPKPARGTPLWHDAWRQMEWYARYMCEGFIDPISTAAQNGCGKVHEGSPEEACAATAKGLYEYTFASCCYDAFGGRWFPSIGTEATELTSADDVRPDAPQGFGGLPGLRVMAETLNRFAAFIDKLRTVRIELPLQLQSRIATARSTSEATPNWSGPGDTACYTVGTKAPPVPDLESEDWGDMASPMVASKGATLAGRSYIAESLGGGWITCDYGWYASREDVQWRVDPSDDALHAIPSLWRDQVHPHLAIYGSLEIGTSQPVSGGQYPFRCGDPDCPLEDYLEWNGTFPDAPKLWSPVPCQDIGTRIDRSCTCVLASGMTITAPDLPPCVNFFWDRSPTGLCHGGAASWASFTPFADGYLAFTVPFSDELES